MEKMEKKINKLGIIIIFIGIFMVKGTEINSSANNIFKQRRN